MTTNAIRVANTQGGAQSRRVTVRLYPSVAVRVGKNALNEREMMMEVILHGVDESNALLEYGGTYFSAIYITFQSVRVSRRIWPWLLTSVWLSSPTPASSSIRFSANLASIGDSQRWEVEGKSGRTNTAMRATRIVRPPSMKNNLFKSDYIDLAARRGAMYHLHAACPNTPSMPSRIPEAMSAPKALLNKLPHERTAVRRPSSLRLYHFERRNKAPCHYKNVLETSAVGNSLGKTRTRKYPKRNASKERQ